MASSREVIHNPTGPVSPSGLRTQVLLLSKRTVSDVFGDALPVYRWDLSNTEVVSRRAFFLLRCISTVAALLIAARVYNPSASNLALHFSRPRRILALYSLLPSSARALCSSCSPGWAEAHMTKPTMAETITLLRYISAGLYVSIYVL